MARRPRVNHVLKGGEHRHVGLDSNVCRGIGCLIARGGKRPGTINDGLGSSMQGGMDM